jgi:hypothetical protein
MVCGVLASACTDRAISNDSTDGGDDLIAVPTCEKQVLCNGKCVDPATDPMNCGGCGSVCNTSCAGGVCSLLPADCPYPFGQIGHDVCLAIDAMNVYWQTNYYYNSDSDAIFSLPLNGGCPSMAVSGLTFPNRIASDGKNLYFTAIQSGPTYGTVNVAPVGGGKRSVIATNQDQPDQILVDAHNVYWTSSGDGSIWKSDKTSPTPMNLAGPFAAGRLYMRVDSTNVYFPEAATNIVNRVPIAGGVVTAVTTPSQALGALAIDEQSLYFVTGSDSGEIATAGLLGTNQVPVPIVHSQPPLRSIQVGGSHLYYTRGDEIHRVTIGGENDTILASSQNQPNCMALDETSVYWISEDGSAVSKTAR